MTRRVVVTGVGLVSAVGIGTEETWQSLLAGRSRTIENRARTTAVACHDGQCQAGREKQCSQNRRGAGQRIGLAATGHETGHATAAAEAEATL